MLRQSYALKAWCSGSSVWFQVSGGSSLQGLGFRGLGLGVYGFRVLGFRGLGFRVLGLGV